MITLTDKYEDEPFTEIVSESNDPAVAWNELREWLINNADSTYAVAVTEWWFMDRDTPGYVTNKSHGEDVWTWTN